MILIPEKLTNFTAPIPSDESIRENKIIWPVQVQPSQCKSVTPIKCSQVTAKRGEGKTNDNKIKYDSPHTFENIIIRLVILELTV